MPSHSIAILDAKTISTEDQLKQFERFSKCTVFQTTAPDQRKEHIGDADIVITNKVLLDREILSACPRVKCICVTATGVNNIDTAYAQEKGIAVRNAAGYSTESVAQFTFIILFHLMARPYYYDRYVKSGEYAKSDVFTHFGPGFWELSGSRWGIIGLGAIGSRVAQIASSFGCEVVYYSTSGKNDNALCRRVDLDEQLAQLQGHLVDGAR
ncbi:MAG: NAD(P)-dependent oxidoreductase, partial [Spirochaetota bacterium]